MTDTLTIRERVAELEQQQYHGYQELVKLREQLPVEPVGAWAFDSPEGRVSLDQLFGEHDELLLVHNMGIGCSYCTMWADGLNGLLAHLENRAAFVVVSPNPVELQQQVQAERGWKFRMVSAPDAAFSTAMGFYGDESYQPGVSAFRRSDDGEIVRTGHDNFGPGDRYNAAWPLFDLLGTGAEWRPRRSYGAG